MIQLASQGFCFALARARNKGRFDLLYLPLRHGRGVSLPDEAEKKQLANQFKDWVRDYLPDAHDGIAWLQVFKEVDNDASGLITFDELTEVLRKKLKIETDKLSDLQIK